jgi:hypothetical protein
VTLLLWARLVLLALLAGIAGLLVWMQQAHDREG